VIYSIAIVLLTRMPNRASARSGGGQRKLVKRVYDRRRSAKKRGLAR
jgi:hypothetical protein